MRKLPLAVVTGYLIVLMPAAWAQEIYACTDGKGRKINADRPITECLDREQKVLNPSGIVKRVVAPRVSAQELAEREEAQKRETEEQMRAAEDKRKERALFARYPNQAAHDRERAEAMAVLDAALRTGQQRMDDLMQQRKELDAQLEFYKKDPTKAPAALHRRMVENEQSQMDQVRYMAEQGDEKKRIHLRFDEELQKLKPRWYFQSPDRPLSSSSGASAGQR